MDGLETVAHIIDKKPEEAYNVPVDITPVEVDNDVTLLDEAPAVVERNYVEEAQRDGWVPKEQYKGAPEKWVPAEKWVERGEIMRPLKAEISKYKRELEEVRMTTFQAMQAFQQVQRQKAEAEIMQLKAQQQAAFESGNYTGYEAAKAKIDEVAASVPQPQQHYGPSENDTQLAARVADEFKQRNADWFETDPVLTQKAQQYVQFEMHQAMQAKQQRGMPPALTPYEFADILGNAEQMFSKGKNVMPKPQPAQVASGSNRGVAQPQQVSANMLKAEDRSIYNHLVQRGAIKTDKEKASFLKEVIASYKS